MPGETPDQEVSAIQAIVSALADLDREARSRVIEYVFRRLGVSTGMLGDPMQLGPVVGVTEVERPAHLPGLRPIDIRALREEKNPRNAVEMAALVAYYLSELAQPAEKKDSIGTHELEKYFKQARFPLPSGSPRYTLTNAKNAGYFDQADRGRYRLTSVGYNLVAHVLPVGTRKRATESKPRASSRSKSRGRKSKSR